MNSGSTQPQICLVIGDPVSQSLSPHMHRAAYEALGLTNKFSFHAARVRAEDLRVTLQGFRILGIRGVSCTMPHKVALLRLVDQIDPLAQKIGAINTLLIEGGTIKGLNTDWLGIVTPLEKLTPLQGKKVLILGAGGAARAAAFGVHSRGAEVTIFNRSPERGRELALAVHGSITSQEMPIDFKGFDIIINATPVGMSPDEWSSPLPPNSLCPGQIVFDTVYRPHFTQLLNEATTQGAQVICGIEMLLYQGVAQFELYTGHKAPVEVMREALTSAVQEKK